MRLTRAPRSSWECVGEAGAGRTGLPGRGRAAQDMLQLRGSGLRLIEGVVADHLKDGRSVRVDFEMTIVDKPQGSTVTQNRQSFVLSFDLWEQRYAVTRAGSPPRSISHLPA